MQAIIFYSLLFLTIPLETFACVGQSNELVSIRGGLLVAMSVFGFSYFFYKWKGGLRYKKVLKILFILSILFLIVSFVLSTSGC